MVAIMIPYRFGSVSCLSDSISDNRRHTYADYGSAVPLHGGFYVTDEPQVTHLPLLGASLTNLKTPPVGDQPEQTIPVVGVWIDETRLLRSASFDRGNPAEGSVGFMTSWKIIAHEDSFMLPEIHLYQESRATEDGRPAQVFSIKIPAVILSSAMMLSETPFRFMVFSGPKPDSPEQSVEPYQKLLFAVVCDELIKEYLSQVYPSAFTEPISDYMEDEEPTPEDFVPMIFRNLWWANTSRVALGEPHAMNSLEGYAVMVEKMWDRFHELSEKRHADRNGISGLDEDETEEFNELHDKYHQILDAGQSALTLVNHFWSETEEEDSSRFMTPDTMNRISNKVAEVVTAETFAGFREYGDFLTLVREEDFKDTLISLSVAAALTLNRIKETVELDADVTVSYMMGLWMDYGSLQSSVFPSPLWALHPLKSDIAAHDTTVLSDLISTHQNMGNQSFMSKLGHNYLHQLGTKVRELGSTREELHNLLGKLDFKPVHNDTIKYLLSTISEVTPPENGCIGCGSVAEMISIASDFGVFMNIAASLLPVTVDMAAAKQGYEIGSSEWVDYRSRWLDDFIGSLDMSDEETVEAHSG